MLPNYSNENGNDWKKYKKKKLYKNIDKIILKKF